MSSSSPAAKPPAGKSAGGGVSAPENEDQDVLVGLWLRFRRFGWDLIGIGLLALGLMSLLGILGLTTGALINPWVRLLLTSVGFGYPLFIAALAVMGLMCLRQHFSSWPKVRLGRVLALEISAFALLALLSIFGGMSVDRAEQGLDGGRIGWGLAYLVSQVLPLPWSTVFLLAFSVFLLGLGTGLLQWGVQRLEVFLNEMERNRSVTPEVETEDAAEEPSAAGENPALDESPDVEVAPYDPNVRDPRLPPLTLLLEDLPAVPDEGIIAETGVQIETTMAEFGLPVRVLGYRVGPTITQFAVEPGFIEKPGPDGELIQQKVRVAQISALQRDLALALRAERLRIEAPVPGRSYVGVEVPNPKNSVVRLRPIMESDAFKKLSSPLAVVLGRDVAGQAVVADLARMPHLLIAGTTGSGKSVCIAALVTCLAVNNTPERLRMALLDPKMVELARFNGLPHLFGKVETEGDRMLGVLKWALMEMDQRYRLLEDGHSRDIETFNRRAAKRGKPQLPRIVVLIDELADLMMRAPDQTEHTLVRLAQMARAVGIHLVVATQRPSTDVVTGLIKANFPARLAFSVASSVDSRVILDTGGAENLLGKGDMLWMNPETGAPMRSQGVMIGENEVESVIAFWARSKAENPQLAGGAESSVAPWEELIAKEQEEESGDALVEQAIKVVKQSQRASVSLIQRKLRIGYPRAARLMDQLEEMGVVGPSQGAGKDRDVLVDRDEIDEDDDGGEGLT
jgi:S-DNA-T family DNA segregation ATPase FtsK/SpoIIIE